MLDEDLDTDNNKNDTAEHLGPVFEPYFPLGTHIDAYGAEKKGDKPDKCHTDEGVEIDKLQCKTRSCGIDARGDGQNQQHAVADAGDLVFDAVLKTLIEHFSADKAEQPKAIQWSNASMWRIIPTPAR